MNRERDWDSEEFGILISNHSLSDEEVAALLPDRSVGAVQVVRGGIHSFHSGGDISMLSAMHRARLEQSAGQVICPVCGTRF